MRKEAQSRVGHVPRSAKRVRAEGALRRAEAAFRALLDDLPDGAIVHRAGVVLYMNRLANAWLGYDDQTTVVGQAVISIVHPSDRESVSQRGMQVMNGQKTPLKEQRLLHRDGHAVVVEVAAMRAVFEGEPAILALGRDITERKKLESRLIVSDRLASIGRLAAAVGHEINNPLTYVIGNLELVQKDLARVLATAPPDAARHVRERMAVVREGVERVRAIVLDLKALARPDGPESGSTSRIDVARVLDVCANMAEHELRGRARLVKDYAPGLYAEASEARLAQAFLNVLLNAGQAIRKSDDGDDANDANTVRVSARREVTASGDGVISIAIADTGIGIPKDIESRIFEPFFSTKGAGGGAGLGLSICHNVVTALGGTIDHTPNLPRGTRFRIRIPAAVDPPRASGGDDPGSPESHALPSPRAAAGVVVARILVVDDEPNLAKLIGYCLEPHAVTVVHSGRAAIEAIVSGPPFDAIVCDLVMDDLTGMDVYEHVRRSAAGAEETMIFMTGGAYTPEARAFVAEVANPVLEKPFEAQRIESLIREVLRKGAARNGA